MTVIGKKKKQQHGSWREWESFFREWTGRDFPPVFSWDWVGKRFIFVGVGRERFENSLPCHPLHVTPCWLWVDDSFTSFPYRSPLPVPKTIRDFSEILCWPAGPHLHTYLQQIFGAVWSPFMLQTLHHHPHPKEIQNYRTKWLPEACGANICGHEVIRKTGVCLPEGHYWTLAGSSLVCLQSKQVCGRCRSQTFH